MGPELRSALSQLPLRKVLPPMLRILPGNNPLQMYFPLRLGVEVSRVLPRIQLGLTLFLATPCLLKVLHVPTFHLTRIGPVYLLSGFFLLLVLAFQFTPHIL